MSRQRWSEEEAWEWFHKQGFRQGANFVPSTASNQLQMWLEFDEQVIHRELEWASKLHYNAMRIFLHNLMWQHQGQAFLDRVDQFLDIASGFGIKIMLVLFDGCWDPHPKYGPQPKPRPFIHNSRWVQAPGAKMLVNNSASYELRSYVEAVFTRFGNDSDRVLLFDLFNEPDNDNGASYGHADVTRVKAAKDAAGTEMNAQVKANAAFKLVVETHKWARALGPFKIPITVGLYGGARPRMAQWMLDHSDVLSFHEYGDIDSMNNTLDALQKHGRPLVCTEYMARNVNSTFDPILGYLKNKSAWAINWGLVSGESQTYIPWDSWHIEYKSEPDLWQHDVLRRNGTPYLLSEYLYIEQLWLQRPESNNNMVAIIAGIIVLSLLLLASMLIFSARRYHVSRYQQRDIVKTEDGDEATVETISVTMERRMVDMD